MTVDDFARLFLWALCPAFLLKTGTFIWMANRMNNQENRTAIGHALVGWCIGLSVVSLFLTVLFGVFVVRFRGDHLAGWLWIMVPLMIGLLATDYYGWKVVQEERKLPI